MPIPISRADISWNYQKVFFRLSCDLRENLCGNLLKYLSNKKEDRDALLRKLQVVSRIGDLSSASEEIIVKVFSENIKKIPSALLGDILIGYHCSEKKQLLVGFLDLMGISHHEGILHESVRIGDVNEDLLPESINKLLEKYNIHDIEIYFGTLLANSDPFLCLYDVLKKGISSYLSESQEVGPEDQLDTGKNARVESGYSKEMEKVEGKQDDIETNGIASLRQGIKELEVLFAGLSDELMLAATNLKSPGVPLDLSVIEKARESGLKFKDISSRILEFSRVSHNLPDAASPSLDSLSDISRLLDETVAVVGRQSHVETLQAKCEVLIKSVLSISHREGVEFRPLEEIHADARRIEKLLLDPTWATTDETRDLIREDHPYRQLLRFLSGEEFDDALWQELHEQIEKHFGKAFAIAATRGKLFVQEKIPGTLPSVEESGGPITSESAKIKSSVPLEGISKDYPSEDFYGESSASSVKQLPGQVEISSADDREGTTLTKDEMIDVNDSQVREDLPSEAEGGGSDKKSSESQENNQGYPFPSNQSSPDIARLILANQAGDQILALRALIWRLAYEDRLAPAFHLARYLESKAAEGPSLPSWVIRLILLGRSLRHSNGVIAGIMKGDFSNYDESIFLPEAREWNKAIRLMLVSATLQATMLAPETQGSRILHSLHIYEEEGGNELAHYCKVIAGFGDKLIPMDPNSIKNLRDQAGWEADLAALQGKVEKWYREAHILQFVYVPAAQVWRRWLQSGGIIHSLLMPVRQNLPAKKKWVADEIGRLSVDSSLKRAIVMTDRKDIGRRHGSEIDLKAITQIRLRLREVLEFARQWVALQEQNSKRSAKGYVQRQTEELKREIWDHHQGLVKQLSRVDTSATPIYLLAGISCCRNTLDMISRLYDPEMPFPMEEPYAHHLLCGDILRIPQIAINDQWEPVSLDEQFAAMVLRQVTGEWNDWEKSFNERLTIGDHGGTGKIIEYIEAWPDCGIDVEDMKKKRVSGIKDSREALRREVRKTQRDVESAVSLGLLNEQTRGTCLEMISRIDREIETTESFPIKLQELSVIHQTIEERKKEGVTATRVRLESLDIEKGSAEYLRVNKLLQQGDVLTSNEYIHLIQNGRPLPEEEPHANVFEEFFPETFRNIEKLLEASPRGGPPDVNRIIMDLRSFARGITPVCKMGNMVLDHMDSANAQQAADLIDAWFTVKRGRKINEGQAKTLLNAIGLSPIRIIIQQGRKVRIKVQSETIKDRDICPVAAYGSEAKGRYQVLCVWDNPQEDKLIQEIRDLDPGEPVIVFYFGSMSENLRRDLAHACRDRRKTFIVIDDIGVLYLCKETKSRVATMFGITLPFTFLEPYTTTAGIVPPEMFYGRKRERDSIVDRMGSCFMFGGRQLGKTALLRDVERSYHDPNRGFVARWFDLKSAGLGIDRDLDELWYILTKDLKKHKVIPDNIPDHTGQDRMQAHIKMWLESDDRRRILLLLDEADRFLERDQKEDFRRTARLKGLMDQTDRRFKVVFAGLHNVQRTTRQENHPLAHYGEPICIGPLIENGEFREAWALVERPIGSLGYKMESRDLTIRILSQTNYYPSLIQLYCSHLLRYVNDASQGGFDRKKSPPYTITSRHIEEAYQSQDLRKAIRDRFMLTLDLDPRYRVIAFSIALYSLSTGWEEFGEEGFSIPWIRRQAVTFWEDGFREAPSEDSFRVLLDEMVGLGVLRQSGEGRYALRSPNVLTLIGTRDEIENELEKVREVPAVFEPATFRRYSYDADRKGDVSIRSPLTAQQESELRSRRNGVSIIFGSKAAGLEYLHEFLVSAFGEGYFTDAGLITDNRTLQANLDRHAKTRQKDGTSLFLVSGESPWADKWILDSINNVRSLKSKNSFVRVVFIADPDTAWRLVSQSPRMLENLSSAGTTFFSLKPWHDALLRKWLEDCGFGPSATDREGRQKIISATGNWPLLLGKFHKSCHQRIHKWEEALDEIDSYLMSPENLQDLLAIFGLDSEIPKKILKDLAVLENAKEEDLVGVVEGIPTEMIGLSLQWADLLGLARPAKNEEWKTDPVLSRLLLGAFPVPGA